MLTAVVCGLPSGHHGDTEIVEQPHDLPIAVWHSMGHPFGPPSWTASGTCSTRHSIAGSYDSANRIISGGMATAIVEGFEVV